MAEINFIIGNILENGSEDMLNYLLYLQVSELSELNFEQKCDLADMAILEGRNEGRHYGMKGLMPEKLASILGIKDICYINKNTEKCCFRAYYEPNTSKIFINNDSIEKMMKILRYYELNYFNERDISRMYILHEVFHHIEERFERRVDSLLRKKFNTNLNLEVFRDIAAFSFVNEYEKNIPCQITDLLWKSYFYPDSIDSMYKVLIDYMSLRT